MMKAINYWVLKRLIDKYPNDKELGMKIREFIKNKEKQNE